jgi:hypothetical protein
MSKVTIHPLIVSMFCLLLAACDEDQHRTERLERKSWPERLVRGDAESLENSRQSAVEALNPLTYEGVRHDSSCTAGCDKQNAGFAWAKRNGITESRSCRGDNPEFIQGCKAYGEELKKSALAFEVSKESE